MGVASFYSFGARATVYWSSALFKYWNLMWTHHLKCTVRCGPHSFVCHCYVNMLRQHDDESSKYDHKQSESQTSILQDGRSIWPSRSKTGRYRGIFLIWIDYRYNIENRYFQKKINNSLIWKNKNTLFDQSTNKNLKEKNNHNLLTRNLINIVWL